MGSIGYTKAELVGLRVVRGPNWEWDTQDGGEGFVGTVVENIQNSRRVKVQWDYSEQEFRPIYRIGAEGAHDLRVLDNSNVRSNVGVKHTGVECRGCGQKDIANLRWQCFDCPTPFDLCTFCFTNGKHDQRHVNFRRYHHPSFDPIVVRLNSAQPRIPLKGIFSGALVRRGADWKCKDEDGWKDRKANPPIGKVVPTPTGRETTPGNVWVQWPCELDKSYSYRVGLNGKIDLKMAKAAIGGHYQPDTLPVLVISKPSEDKKTNEVVADPPLVVGDRVKVVVGLEELREMSVDSGKDGDEMEKVVKEILIIKKIHNKDNTAKVVIANKNSIYPKSFWLPVKAIRRLIPWLPVGAVVQVINKSYSNGMDMEQDVMAGEFGRVKQVNHDGKTVDMEFLTTRGNVMKTVDVDQLELVDVSVVKKVDADKKESAKLLLSEVKKGSILSVQFLLKNYPNIINCQSPFNGRNSTALSVACQKGNVEMVKLLLKHKASVDIADEQDKEEDEEDEEDEEEEFNKKGKKDEFFNEEHLQFREELHYIDEDDDESNIAVEENIEIKGIKGIKEILEAFDHWMMIRNDDDDEDSGEDSDDDDDSGEDSDDDDESNKKGLKPIHHAVIRNHPELLRLLLGNGASPTDTKWNLRTPLHLAAMKGHIECVRVLLEDERCDLYFEASCTAFRLAVESSVQSVELFNLFRATGRLNIIEKNFLGENLLHLAAEYNNLGLAKSLLSCPEGKKLACECDVYDKTPLFIACEYSRNQIAKLLVSNMDNDENGKPWGIDTPNKEGKTPLMIVVEEFNYELIEFLIGAGANLQAIDKKGDTPFHYAARLYRGKVTTFEGRPFFKMNFISWPNQETAPAIFKIYNELKTKHPEENLPPIVAIICFLVAKGGIPHNLTLPEIKNLVGENFLYDEIITFSHDQLNSMSKNFDNQGNPLQDSPPVEWSGTNGVAVGAYTFYGCNGEIADENPLSMPSLLSPLSVLNKDNSYLEANYLVEFDTYLEQLYLTDPVNSISQQQHPLSSEHQSNDSGSIFPIPNENVPVSVTPTGTTAANTFAATSVGEHITPSDNNGSISATIDVPYIDEIINSQGASISMSNDQPTADTSTADPAAGSTRTAEEVICTFEEKNFIKRKGGPAEEKTSLIIKDESGRRYSQQKKDVSDIFQCTANVSTPNKPNGSKKCKGTIYVQDLAGSLKEWKTTPGKKFMFKVRNPHEEHLPKKRGRQLTDTESDASSTSNKRKKKT